jgi:archaellum component FlaG (FlaF/FlaG flagellin family)
MKSRTAFAAVASLLILVFSVSAQDSGKPKLSITSLEHSFGSVKTGTPLTYSFEIKNEGKVDLEIKSVSPSCGCTTSKYDKVIAPGKVGSVTLEVAKTDGYKGEVSKTASVTTNDPDHQTFTLTLRASFTE